MAAATVGKKKTEKLPEVPATIDISVRNWLRSAKIAIEELQKKVDALETSGP